MHNIYLYTRDYGQPTASTIYGAPRAANEKSFNTPHHVRGMYCNTFNNRMRNGCVERKKNRVILNIIIIRILYTCRPRYPYSR